MGDNLKCKLKANQAIRRAFLKRKLAPSVEKRLKNSETSYAPKLLVRFFLWILEAIFREKNQNITQYVDVLVVDRKTTFAKNYKGIGFLYSL